MTIPTRKEYEETPHGWIERVIYLFPTCEVVGEWRYSVGPR